MSKTMREKFTASLTKMGETRVKQTHKFDVYTRKAGGYYYLGRSGSLRFGTTVAGSIPVAESFKKALLAEHA